MKLKQEWTQIEDIDSLSDSTKTTYGSYMRSLYEYTGLRNQSEFLELSDSDLQKIMEDFLRHLKKRVKNNEISPNTVPKLFKAYKILLEVNYREYAVKWKPISMQFPKGEKRSGHKPWTTPHIQLFLDACGKSLKKKALIHFQASTGGRVGVHNDPLLIKHMVKMETPELGYHCYAILVYADADESVSDKDARISTGNEEDENDYSFFVFLTPEAARALDKYHAWRKQKYNEVFTEDTPIFASVNKNQRADLKVGDMYQMTGNAFRHLMEELIENSSVNRTKKRNRFDIMIDHGYRKRFNTVLKLDSEVNANIAEKLMQHAKGLDGAYLTPTREQCFTEFIKAISELTLSDKERQNNKIQTTEQKNQELESRIAAKDALIKKMAEEVMAQTQQVPEDQMKEMFEKFLAQNPQLVAKTLQTN